MARIKLTGVVDPDAEPNGDFRARYDWWKARLTKEYRETGRFTLPPKPAIAAQVAKYHLHEEIEQERRNGKNPTLSIVR